MAIGVFDSGIGGLSVHHALVRRLPAADFTYLTPTEHRDLMLARQRTQRSREL